METGGRPPPTGLRLMEWTDQSGQSHGWGGVGWEQLLGASRGQCTPSSSSAQFISRGDILLKMDNDTAASDFDFDDWATTFKLSRKCTAALRKDDCDAVEALRLVTAEDINRMDVPVGQVRLLRKALRELGNPIPMGKEDDTDDHEEDEVEPGASGIVADTLNAEVLAQASRELNKLLGKDDQEASGSGAQTERATTSTAEKEGSRVGTLTSLRAVAKPPSKREPVSLNQLIAALQQTTPAVGRADDPLTLLTVKATTTKALRILDFLPETVRNRVSRRRREQVTFSTLADGGVALRAEEAGQYYISIEEWSAANMRLAAQLVKDGQLKVEGLLYYMAYTALVSDLASKYDWLSILEFDTKYRELQAEYQFNWGTPHPHTERYYLRPRRVMVAGERGRHGGANDQSKNRDIPVCRMYVARGKCSFGDTCKYRHEKPQVADKATPKNE